MFVIAFSSWLLLSQKSYLIAFILKTQKRLIMFHSSVEFFILISTLYNKNSSSLFYNIYYIKLNIRGVLRDTLTQSFITLLWQVTSHFHLNIFGIHFRWMFCMNKHRINDSIKNLILLKIIEIQNVRLYIDTKRTMEYCRL